MSELVPEPHSFASQMWSGVGAALRKAVREGGVEREQGSGEAEGAGKERFPPFSEGVDL